MTHGRLRVLVLGWHDATPRHLRAVARLHTIDGHVVTPVLSGSGRALARRGGFRDEGRMHARALARAHELEPRGLLVHSFSNAGFWTYAAILDALAREHPFVLDAHVGTILDSAPGFAEDMDAAFTARTAPMAFLPGLRRALRGLDPRASASPPEREPDAHPLLTPLLSLFFGAWHVLAPSQIAFMRSALATVREAHSANADRAALPLLGIWGGADRLVEPRYVEAFLDRCEADRVPVERLFFPDSLHVRHLVSHRAAYERAVRDFSRRLAEREEM